MVTQTYEPRGAAKGLLLARDPFVIASGPAGTGKTLAALWKAHITSLQVPGCVSLLLRQTHASLTSSTLMTFERQVIGPALASGKVKWFGGSGRKPPAYMYDNGSLVIPGGLDKPGKFLSMDVSRIYVDEANQVSVAAIETLITRLRGQADTYRQILCMTNPDHPDHHLKKRADAGDARMICSVHQDNPYLFHADGTPTDTGRDYLARLEGLTGVRRLRFLKGIWAAAEGLVYGDWQDAVNVIDAADVPETNRVIWAVDFGYSNAFVWQEWRIDSDGRMYLTREISRKQRLVEDHARDILELTGGYRPEAIICDHDAEDRATLERHLGMPTIPARKAVTRGVQLVGSRVRKAADGLPRLFVVRDALQGRDTVAEALGTPRGFQKEILGYVWAVETGSDGIPKEMPQKLNDHSMDTGRYAVAYLDWNDAAKVGNPAAVKTAQSQPGSVWAQRVAS